MPAERLHDSARISPFREIARGLDYPEGPVWCSDGSILVVEVGGGCLTRIAPDGTVVQRIHLGGGPNGAAIGPDGATYVCNDGGFLIQNFGSIRAAVAAPPGDCGGCIQRVTPSGGVTTLYSNFRAGAPEACTVLPLRSPDDLVFDNSGNFWFTDWGKSRDRVRDITGVYYANPDGSSITEAIFPLQSPNGIGLSPEEDRLYVAETYTRRILFWELSKPGVIKRNWRTTDGSYILTARMPYAACLDSLALDEEGNIYVASFLPHGPDPNTRGGITVVSPRGEVLEWIEIDIGAPDPLPSNICFGDPDRTTMYITLSGTGRLIACEARVPGKRPAFVA